MVSREKRRKREEGAFITSSARNHDPEKRVDHGNYMDGSDAQSLTQYCIGSLDAQAPTALMIG